MSDVDPIAKCRPTLMAAAETLEKMGCTHAEIADAMMIVGLDIGNATQGPRATARVLYLTSLALTKQADEEEAKPKH